METESTSPTSGVGESSGFDETEADVDEEVMQYRLLKNICSRYRLAMVPPQLPLQWKYTRNATNAIEPPLTEAIQYRLFKNRLAVVPPQLTP